jgi:hypothetical protein
LIGGEGVALEFTIVGASEVHKKEYGSSQKSKTKKEI